LTHREWLEKRLMELDPVLLASVVGQQAIQVLARAIAEAKEEEQRLEIEREQHRMEIRERRAQLALRVSAGLFAMAFLTAQLVIGSA